MNNSKLLLATVFAAVSFSFAGAQAAADVMEKCEVMNKEGKKVTVMATKEDCAKFQKGDFTSASKEVKAELGEDAE